jgi:hypothetical protein
MVVPLFGWSAGDLVVSIQILCAIGSAFTEATGAKAQYAEASSWLRSFASDLERVKEYTDEHPQAKYTNNMVEQIAMIDKHYAEFEGICRSLARDCLRRQKQTRFCLLRRR